VISYSRLCAGENKPPLSCILLEELQCRVYSHRHASMVVTGCGLAPMLPFRQFLQADSPKGTPWCVFKIYAPGAVLNAVIQ
jgi:hypothetical protein